MGVVLKQKRGGTVKNILCLRVSAANVFVILRAGLLLSPPVKPAGNVILSKQRRR